MDTFGNKLKNLRNDRKKQQKEVAIDLNVSKTGYSSYENDSRMPGIKMLIKIADYYNVSIDYLLGRDDRTYIDKTEIVMYIRKINEDVNILENYINKSK